jgi:hypothetical protein
MTSLERLSQFAQGVSKPVALRRRVITMALLWAFMGILVGASGAPVQDAIGLFSGGLAGMIVLSVLGTALSLFGGQWQETLAGAGCGFLMCLAAAALLGQSNLIALGQVGLVSGGMVGATTVGVVRMIRSSLRTVLARRSC